MKRIIFCLILLFCLTACTESEKKSSGFVLYFPNEATADFVQMSFDRKDLTLHELVEEYAQLPLPENASTAIPEAWILQEAKCEDGIAIINFRGTAVSDLETNKAAACLLQTVLQLPEIQSLHLIAPEHEAIQLTRESLLLSDSGMLPQKESIVLYVPDKEGRFLLQQTQTVEAVEAADKPRYVLQQLFDTADSCIPKGTKLLNISVEHEICTVDLSSEFLHNMPPSFHCERMAVYAIVNSLTELNDIKTVEFWIEAAPLEELKFMKLANGLAHNESLLAPSDEGYFDATLYASCDGKGLVKVPLVAEISDEKTVEETVLDALLSFTTLDGAQNYIPEGTKRLSVLCEGNNCIVDLTGEFLHGCKDAMQEQLAVQSVIATMCELPGVSSVEILVEGLKPDYSDPGLKNFTAPQVQWFSEE